MKPPEGSPGGEQPVSDAWRAAVLREQSMARMYRFGFWVAVGASAGVVVSWWTEPLLTVLAFAYVGAVVVPVTVLFGRDESLAAVRFVVERPAALVASYTRRRLFSIPKGDLRTALEMRLFPPTLLTLVFPFPIIGSWLQGLGREAAGGLGLLWACALVLGVIHLTFAAAWYRLGRRRLMREAAADAVALMHEAGYTWLWWWGWWRDEYESD